jgi:DUF305 family protein family protein
MVGDSGRPAASTLAVALTASFLALAGDAASAPSTFAAEAPYLAQNDAAMKKMMSDMTVKPTGDVDRDFVAMMVPHHQGAIDMAVAVLRYGHNETIRRLAQEIIITQQEEIAAMRLAVGEPILPSTPLPTQASAQRRSPMPANMKMK